MSDSFIKAASLALAWGFSGATAWLLLALADGWASRAALGKGAVLSLLSIVLAVPFSVALAGVAHSIDGPLAAAVTRAFLAAALCEESGRLIALLVLMRMMITSDPREFFIGVVAIGLGFGIIENLLYLQRANMPLLIGALRGVMTAPAHLSFALLTGLGVWRWRRERAPMSVLVGMFLLAIMAHGAYDFAAMAWPNPREWPTSALSPFTLVGLGALLVLATAAQGLAAFTAIDSFLWRIDETPPHDRTAARAPLSPLWTLFGRTLSFAGALLGLGAIAGVVMARSIVLPFLPLALAAAVSTGFWGVGWSYLASRQRESARAWRSSAATHAKCGPDRFRTAA